jgi:hypothetical protein
MVIELLESMGDSHQGLVIALDAAVSVCRV